MYEAFFDLSRRPFVAAPQPERYFPAAAIEGSRQTLARCIERCEGIGVVVGPSGTGKSLLLHVLARQFADSLGVVLLDSGRVTTRRALLQTLLFELQQPFRGMDEGELRLSLIDQLASSQGLPEGILLLVDEAHSLPLRLLDELRMIASFARNGQLRARLMLAGAASLEERLASPKLESLNQRVTARCYLEPFVREETETFVRAQIEAAGGCIDEAFTAEALQNIFSASDGIPRLVNQICDHAMTLAALGGKRPIDGAGIEEAWADLQQLPPPWSPADDESSGGGSGLIEFGELGDETGDADDPHGPASAEEAVEREAPAIEIGAGMSIGDDEFQPAGTIGPEVEYVFHEPERGIDEAFEEEEVIIDHYAELDRSSWAPRKKVFSTEGRELAELLGAAASGGPMDSRIAERQVASSPDATGRRPTDVMPPRDQAQLAGSHEDDDLIVVDPDEDDGTAHVEVAHRGDYRQLFTKLRHG